MVWGGGLGSGLGSRLGSYVFLCIEEVSGSGGFWEEAVA